MRWVGLVVGVGLLWAAPLAAADIAEPLALRYDAPAGCPDAAAFFGQVTARTSTVRAPRDGGSARELYVRLAPTGAGTGARAGFIGHLHFKDGTTSSSPRVVEGASCTEVAEALGLVAALAVDPTASTAPAAALPASKDAGAATVADDGGTTPSTSDRSAPDAGPNTEPAHVDASAAEEPRAQPVHNTRFGAGIAVEAAAMSAFVPSGRVFGEIVLRDRAEVFAPSIRVFGARSLDVERSRSASAGAVGTASLRWTYAGFDVCPVRIGLAPTLSLRPCVELNAGVLEADSSGSNGVSQPRDRERAWVATDLHGRLAWKPVGFLALELEGGAMVPFVRETFLFLPRTDVYHAPILAFFGRAGASVRFP